MQTTRDFLTPAQKGKKLEQDQSPANLFAMLTLLSISLYFHLMNTSETFHVKCKSHSQHTYVHEEEKGECSTVAIESLRDTWDNCEALT